MALLAHEGHELHMAECCLCDIGFESHLCVTQLINQLSIFKKKNTGSDHHSLGYGLPWVNGAFSLHFHWIERQTSCV